jgi:hypothetical protein
VGANVEGWVVIFGARFVKRTSHTQQNIHPEIAISWQFMAPETAPSGYFWIRILWPEIAKMMQFWGPETAGIWLFLDIFLKYLFFSSTWS